MGEPERQNQNGEGEGDDAKATEAVWSNFLVRRDMLYQSHLLIMIREAHIRLWQCHRLVLNWGLHPLRNWSRSCMSSHSSEPHLDPLVTFSPLV